MSKARFEARLMEGHDGVTAVVVPFDPEMVWRKKPVKLEGRRHGWLIRGTANGVRFDGYIGERWGRFFILVDPELREAAGASVGDTVTFVIEPASTAKALQKARVQSKKTTAPGRSRADALELAKPRKTARRAR